MELKLTEDDFDNRDDHTTTLIIRPKGWEVIKVDVDPWKVFINMLENCYEGRNYTEEQIDTSDLQDMVDYLNSLLNQ